VSTKSERPAVPPPPTIGADRVLHYAILGASAGYKSGHGLLFVDGEEIGKVPCLAICKSSGSPDVVLYYCEKDWNSLAVSAHDSAEGAKERAERIYPGSAALWVEAAFTEEDAERYLDDVYRDFRCSFCGKRGDLVGQMFAGNGTAQICDECVAEFHAGMSNAPPQTE
jgi:ClpX C4-type zinc finger protein